MIKRMPNYELPWLGQGRKVYMKQYLCIEDGELFITEALDTSDARENAAMWNGEVIRELTQEEVDSGEGVSFDTFNVKHGV